MSVLSVLRLSLWGAVLVFSIIVLGLSAHFLWLEAAVANAYNSYNNYDPYGYDDYGNVYPAYEDWTAMAVATAGLTILTLPIFIGIDMGRTGAYTSMIAVEMVTISLLCILWLTTATIIDQASIIFFQATTLSCGPDGTCNEFKAIEAFSFLCFFVLLVYVFVLLVFTLIAHNRGHTRVWLQSVKQTNFFAPPGTPPQVEKSIPTMAGQPQYQSPPDFGTPASDITLTPAPDVTLTPAPDVTPTPAPDITPTPAPDVAPIPAPEITPTRAPDITPTPAPEQNPGLGEQPVDGQV